ncbi:MAG: Uma2 family endonuclease [Planctomycetota bacterium]
MAISPTSGDSTSEPTWEVAHLFPFQGSWSESDFFRLHGNRMVELVDGYLEVLPMPTWLHQLMVDFLCDCLKSHLKRTTEGRVLQAPLPVRLFAGTIREPDVMYFAPGSEPEDPHDYPTHVDLAMEVVSDGSEARARDFEAKRGDYEKAGIPEYWIVDPEGKAITVLVLVDGGYIDHGVFGVDQEANGQLLPGFGVDVSALMKLGEQEKT